MEKQLIDTVWCSKQGSAQLRIFARFVPTGNKCDVLGARAVAASEAAAFAAGLGMAYVETSATHETNVEMAYVTLACTIIRQHRACRKQASSSPTPAQEEQTNNS